MSTVVGVLILTIAGSSAIVAVIQTAYEVGYSAGYSTGYQEGRKDDTSKL